MRGKTYLSVVIIGLLCAVMLACGGNDDKPIYDAEAEGNGELSGRGGIYDIGGTATTPDNALEEEYVSPFGPPKPKPIQWGYSIPAAVSKAKPGSGKKILVWFTSKSCTECQRAEAGTFKSEVVLKEADKYIWVKFDVDANREKAEYYIQDHNPPVLKWLSQEGNSYHVLYGGFDDPELVARRLIDWH